MAGIPDQAELQRRLGQQILGPLDEAVALARRYRDVEAFHDYVGRRASDSTSWRTLSAPL